jgi:hypothetical protein
VGEGRMEERGKGFTGSRCKNETRERKLMTEKKRRWSRKERKK